MAVPMRTIVLPAAIAASISSDIPRDNVSTVGYRVLIAQMLPPFAGRRQTALHILTQARDGHQAAQFR